MNIKVLSLGLAMTIISSFSLPSLANEDIAVGSQSITRKIINITPMDLVNSAYQGRFGNSNIPSHGGLLAAIRSNKVDSELLVKNAIKSGRLDPEKINDRSYLNSVQDLLELKVGTD